MPLQALMQGKQFVEQLGFMMAVLRQASSSLQADQISRVCVQFLGMIRIVILRMLDFIESLSTKASAAGLEEQRQQKLRVLKNALALAVILAGVKLLAALRSRAAVAVAAETASSVPYRRIERSIGHLPSWQQQFTIEQSRSLGRRQLQMMSRPPQMRPKM